VCVHNRAHKQKHFELDLHVPPATRLTKGWG
jgi:hypothetical protein